MLEHPNVVARFLREASAAGRIGNRHIIESFDAGTLDSGEPFLVMELLDGETLHTRLERLGTLPVEEMADLIGQACDGVQAAHEAGIVHRDLKPENLFIVQKRVGPLVKILDFGISKFDPTLTGAHAVTREGSTLGTPYYMSPEQVEGDKALDARADVYALGVILYECATGQRPYEAEALPRLSLMIHEGKPTPLAELRPDLPPAFVEVVAHAMANDRDQRFASAAELGDALAHFGSSALDVTLEEPAPGAVAYRSSKRPAAARISAPIPPSQQSSSPPVARPAPGKANVKPISPSTAGAAISVAREKRPALWWLAVAAMVVAAAGASFFVFRSSDVARPSPSTSPTVLGAAPLSTPTTPASATAEPVQAPTATPPAPKASAAAIPAGDAGAPSASAVSPKPAVAPTSNTAVKVQAKPAATTRVDQRGLVGDNPF
jgi:serine/threonine-protein kinase